jgi:hypothetical protein
MAEAQRVRPAVSSDVERAIDADVLAAARDAAARSAARLVIGWWNDGAERCFMLLPEGHRVTTEPPFLPLVLVTPSGQTRPLAA